MGTDLSHLRQQKISGRIPGHRGTSPSACRRYRAKDARQRANGSASEMDTCFQAVRVLCAGGVAERYGRNQGSFGVIVLSEQAHSGRISGAGESWYLPPTPTQPTLTRGPVMSDQSTAAHVVYKEIPNHPGYRVGDDGSVWSCKKCFGIGVGLGGLSKLTDSWRRLKPFHDKGGYFYISVCTNGIKHRFALHSLVLTVFVCPCPSGMEACHFPDRNRSNNNLNNLRWDTRSANHADKCIHGTKLQGESVPVSKLTEREVIEIRSAFANAKGSHKVAPDGVIDALAEKYGVVYGTIAAVVRRITWKHI